MPVRAKDALRKVICGVRRIEPVRPTAAALPSKEQSQVLDVPQERDFEAKRTISGKGDVPSNKEQAMMVTEPELNSKPSTKPQSSPLSQPEGSTEEAEALLKVAARAEVPKSDAVKLPKPALTAAVTLNEQLLAPAPASAPAPALSVAPTRPLATSTTTQRPPVAADSVPRSPKKRSWRPAAKILEQFESAVKVRAAVPRVRRARIDRAHCSPSSSSTPDPAATVASASKPRVEADARIQGVEVAPKKAQHVPFGALDALAALAAQIAREQSTITEPIHRSESLQVRKGLFDVPV